MSEDNFARLETQHKSLGEKVHSLEKSNLEQHEAINTRMNTFLSRQVWSAASLLLAVIVLIITSYWKLDGLGDKVANARLEDVSQQVKILTTQEGVVIKVADLELEIKEGVNDLKEHEQSRHDDR